MMNGHSGVAYDNLPYSLGSSVDGTYSMDAEGMFYEWSTYREFSISDKSVRGFRNSRSQ